MGYRPSKNLLGLLPPEERNFTSPKTTKEYIEALIRAIIKDRTLLVNVINEYQSGGSGWPCPLSHVAHYDGYFAGYSVDPVPLFDECNDTDSEVALVTLTASDLAKCHCNFLAGDGEVTPDRPAFELPVPGGKGKFLSFVADSNAFIIPPVGSYIQTPRGRVTGGTYGSPAHPCAIKMYGVDASTGAYGNPLVLVSRDKNNWDAIVTPAEYTVLGVY